nr:hypothetical protein Iba_chr10bCG12410 [Ipomoea batatas]
MNSFLVYPELWLSVFLEVVQGLSLINPPNETLARKKISLSLRVDMRVCARSLQSPLNEINSFFAELKKPCPSVEIDDMSVSISVVTHIEIITAVASGWAYFRDQSISGLVDLDVGQEPGDNPGGGESVMDFFENIGQALLGFQHVLAFPLAGLAVVHQDLDVFQAVHVHFLHLVERRRRLRDLLRASLQGLHAQVERGALVHRQRLVVGQMFHELLDGRGVGRAVRDHHAAVLLPVVHVA